MLARTEELCREALVMAPNHPEALRLIGRCAYERGDNADAALSLVAAVRSMRDFALPSAAQYVIWFDLSFMLTQALSGMDSQFAVKKRAEYDAWRAGLPKARTSDGPLVSVVLFCPFLTTAIDDALASVYRQTHSGIELVVVVGDRDPRAAATIADSLRGCPFPHRVLLLPGASEPAMINAGVRASSGAFINVLDARDRLSETRVAAMAREVAGRGLAWGFSNVDFIDGTGRMVDAARVTAVSRARESLRAIAEADTVGFALLHQVFIAVAVGNLFFSRDLFDDVGGFRDMPRVYAWDFCLRALLRDEPWFVPTREYRRNVSAIGDSSAQWRQSEEIEQIEAFKGFYRQACEGTEVRNVFAPSLSHWRMHFLKTPFRVGHVLAFPLEQLETLARQIADRRFGAAASEMLPGVNLVGFAFGEFGLAENLRALAKACAIGDIPFAVRDVDMQLKARQADRTVGPHIVDELRHACSVFCLNPDMLKPVRHLMKNAKGEPRYNVGFWFWELDRVPAEWTPAIEAIDEIWVATEFIADAMRAATSKPVIKVPTPIEVMLSRPYTRAEFDLPRERFLFLFSFDFNSFVMRKNPQGAIKAFKSAFDSSRRDVGLVVKSINGANQHEMFRELQDLVAEDDRIVIIDGFFTRDQVNGLESVADAYVSLHRAEGLGLGLAESMYLGKPVIGTGYSGNLEFMDSENSCLVDYRLVPIRRDEYLYHDEQFQWAEPDLEQAAHWMARLADDETFRTRIAMRGQQTIRTRFTHAGAAALMRKRLVRLGLL